MTNELFVEKSNALLLHFRRIHHKTDGFENIETDNTDFLFRGDDVRRRRGLCPDAGRRGDQNCNQKKFFHSAACPVILASRALRRRSKSSPAWCDDRVSGEAETIRKPF